MVKWKDEIVAQLTDGVAQLCRQTGVELVDGFAQFENAHTVSIDGMDKITFESAIIATGSRPMSLPEFSFDAEPIMDARQALAVE